jgi:hypothetical protein
MRRKSDLVRAALLTAAYLLLGGASAFAAACSATGLPSGNEFETSAPTGTLDGPIIYPECDSTGSVFVAFPTTDATIPFFLPTPEQVLISVSEVFPPVLGAYFDLLVNGVSFAQSPIPPTQQGSDSLIVDVPAGLSLLGITDLQQASEGINATYSFNDLSVAIQTDFSLIPEPATLGLLGFSAACLAALRRRRLSPA